MLDATVLHVDEASYQARARQAATHRDVWASQSSDGHRMLIARADSGDITVFYALVNRIAEALADDGDDDPVGARRAKAIGIAGYPDRALDLLLRHCEDPDTHQHPEDRQAAADEARPIPPIRPTRATRPTRGHPNPPRPAGEPSSTATTTNPAPTNPAPTLPPTTIPKAGPVTVRRSNHGATGARPRLGGRRRQLRDPARPTPRPHHPPSRQHLPLLPGVVWRYRPHRPGPHPPLPDAAGHRAKPDVTTSVHWPAANTAPEPSATGRCDNPTPAPTCGEPPKAGSPSPPTKAPLCSATPNGPPPSGAPPNHPSPPPPDPALRLCQPLTGRSPSGYGRLRSSDGGPTCSSSHAISGPLFSKRSSTQPRSRPEEMRRLSFVDAMVVQPFQRSRSIRG